MSAMQPVFSDTLLTLDGDADMEIGGGMFGGGRGGLMDIPASGELPNLRLYGNHWEDFDEGLRMVAEGRFPTAYGEAMVSMALAELNGLTLGDPIRLYGSLSSGEGDERVNRQVVHDLVIVGIYFDMTPENAAGGFVRASFLNRRNEVLTTLETVINPLGEGESGITITAVYYLREPSLLPDFENAARALGLSDLLLVTTNEAEYLAIVEPVAGLRGITSTFLVIVLTLGGIVLMVLASISVRERKYEIGVLRAMGMKKNKLALGLMAETLTLTLICLALGLTAGTAVAQPLSDRLLAAQLESIAANEPAVEMVGFGGMFGGGMGGRIGQMLGGGGPQAEPLAELDVSLGLRTVLEIIGISSLLAVLAGAVSILRITKYEPMKILMERN
jgi:putative ABC transport system permease protein